MLPNPPGRFVLLVIVALAAGLFASPAEASPFSPATLDAAIQQCMADIDADSLFSYMNQLAAFGTRHTNSDTTSSTTGIGAARRWVFDKFTEFANQGGNITASYHNYTTVIQGINAERRNVIGEIPGTATGADLRVYLIGGHLDSRNDDPNDAVGPAPGVDDDASGIACLLELARVMSLKSWPMTLRCVAFSGEEQGLFGSQFLANEYRLLNEPVAAMLNNDTMAGINGAPHPDSTVFTDSTLARCFASEPEEGQHRQFQRYLKAMGDVYVPIQNIVLIPAEDRPGRGGDHQSFADAGFTALRYMEHNERVDLQHTPFDTMGVHLDKNYLRRNAQVDLATLANLMKSPAVPTGLTAADIGDSSGFRLTWPTTNTEPDLAGYRVTMRTPGALDYEQVFDVGLVNELEVLSPLASTLYFGLSAVNTGGHQSLVSGEVLASLSSLPQAPTSLVVTSSPSSISLAWNANAESDLDGYHVYRSTTSGSGYVQLTGAPLASPAYVDASALPGVMYFYVVSAVDLSANVSPFSNEDRGRLVTLDSGVLFVDETRDGPNAWNPSDTAADSVYANMLASVPHDVWDVDQSGIPTLADLGAYSSVIWAGDDTNPVFQGNINVTQLLAQAADVLSSYMDFGGNTLVVGWDGRKGFEAPLNYPFDLGPGEFLYDYFGVDDVASKRGRGFTGTQGQAFFPSVGLESSRLNPNWMGTLTRVEYFTAVAPGTNVAFLFDSATPDSVYHGEPCGLYRDSGGYRSAYWGFPLYHLTTADGAAALEQVLGFFGEIATSTPTLEAPVVLALGQNRPNPFLGATEIDFAIPNPGMKIDLSIFDVTGRRVRSLVRGKLEPGVYREVWDGRNSKGQPVASGVYFYRLVGGDRRLTKKLVLLQ